MEYDGLSYSIYEVTGAIVGTGDSNGGVGVGTERGCGDQGPWSDDVAVARIGGVDPRTALVTPVASYILYVAEGVSVDELPSDIAELVAPYPCCCRYSTSADAHRPRTTWQCSVALRWQFLHEAS
jgi:hypothetical protein